MSQSIFERYGGFTTVSKIVMSFYEKILGSPVTNPFFADTDMKKLIDHQTKFIASMMGGPASYTNDHLERVHVHLGITEEAFMEAVEMFVETLEDFGMNDDDVDQVKDEVMSRKNFIVTKS